MVVYTFYHMAFYVHIFLSLRNWSTGKQKYTEKDFEKLTQRATSIQVEKTHNSQVTNSINSHTFCWHCYVRLKCDHISCVETTEAEIHFLVICAYKSSIFKIHSSRVNPVCRMNRPLICLRFFSIVIFFQFV